MIVNCVSVWKFTVHLSDVLGEYANFGTKLEPVFTESYWIVVSICRIPDAFGRDIEKACQSIYPLHDVFIRKVKVLKKPKFDRKFALYYFTRFIKIVWCVLVFNTASIKTWVTKTWDNVKGFLTCTTSPLAWSVVVVAKTPWKNLYIKYWRNWWTEFDSSGICILMKAFQLPQH